MVSRKRPRDVVAWRRTAAEYMGINESMTQAVQALEIASELAVKRNSSEDLTGAAHGWMRMTETIQGLNSYAEASAERAAADMSGKPATDDFGFRAPQPHKIDGDSPVVEEEDVD